MLRLIFHGRLLPALLEARAFSAVTFRRVIDNAPVRLSTEELWVQLNYQLVHLLDFLPAGDWETEILQRGHRI